MKWKHTKLLAAKVQIFRVGVAASRQDDLQKKDGLEQDLYV